MLAVSYSSPNGPVPWGSGVRLALAQLRISAAWSGSTRNLISDARARVSREWAISRPRLPKKRHGCVKKATLGRQLVRTIGGSWYELSVDVGSPQKTSYQRR